jgi:hypothetical protein
MENSPSQENELMTTTTDYTFDAQEMIGEFVLRAGKSFLTVRATDVFGEPTTLKITLTDAAEFYATQANNITSGIRTLAGHGDWRPISQLAEMALGWFKTVNVEGMRRAVRKVGLFPKF